MSMRQGILKTDGVQRQFRAHVFESAKGQWSGCSGVAPESIFGKLGMLEINREALRGYSGASFSSFSGENFEAVESRLRRDGGQVIGGFCYLRCGEICGTGTVNGRTINVDLKNTLPKPIFKGGMELTPGDYTALGIESLPSELPPDKSGGVFFP
ncbi:MAG: hypothetical protein V1909_03995 [Candidatus Micrarchaeota archaeon]